MPLGVHRKNKQAGVVRLEQASQQVSNDNDNDDCLLARKCCILMWATDVDVAAAAVVAATSPWSLGFRHLVKPSILLL